MLDPHQSLDELYQGFAKHVAELICNRLTDAGVGSQRREELRDEPAMADSLGVSQQTLERLRKQGKVPCVRLGRRVLYRPEAVLEALSETASGGQA